MAIADKENRTTALLAELKLEEPFGVQKAAWQSFVLKHGYAIVSVEDFEDCDWHIPDAFFVDDPQIYFWCEDITPDKYPAVDFAEQFRKDGGVFINDIWGVEPETYLDTPENRKIIIEYLEKHPDAHIKEWREETPLRDENKWLSYLARFGMVA